MLITCVRQVSSNRLPMSIRPSLEAVLFDLDGTLVDTAGDLIAAVNRLMLRYQRSPVSTERLRPYVSQGGLRLICEAFKIEDSSSFALELRTEYLDLYRENISNHSRLFCGMTSFLSAVEASNLKWGIVTNKPEWLTHPLLAEMGLDRRASCVVGGDTLSESKPSPAPVLHACKALNVTPGNAVMIGDDRRDIEAGASAGTMTIAAGWGYLLPNENPANWHADYYFESVKQLHDWFY